MRGEEKKPEACVRLVHGDELVILREDYVAMQRREKKAREIIEGLMVTVDELTDNDELIWMGQAREWLKDEAAK